MNLLEYIRTANNYGGLLRAHWQAGFALQLRAIARAGILAGGIGLAVGCSGEKSGPTPEPSVPDALPLLEDARLFRLPGMTRIDCDRLVTLIAPGRADAVELRAGDRFIASRGSLCETAGDPTACHAASFRLLPPDDPESAGPVHRIILTGPHGAEILYSHRPADRARARRLIGTLDSIERAAAWAFITERIWCGDDARIRSHERGFQGAVVSIAEHAEEGEIVLYELRPDGSFRTLDREAFTTYDASLDDMPTEGRRPDGLSAAPPPRDLGGHLARMAYHEAASIIAFADLARQLERWGAPRELVVDCVAAAGEEARHAEIAEACARRFGGSPAPVRPPPRRERDLESLAIENAREGCARELFGAVLAAYQAEAATHADVRALMAEIAPDEASHAALSLRLACWMDERLSPAGRRRVEASRVGALDGLRRSMSTHDRLPYRATLGLPPSPIARWMIDRLDAPMAT